MRFWTRRPLYWDDLVLAIGAISYIIATVLFYMNIYYWYLAHALLEDPELVTLIPLDDIIPLTNSSLGQFTGWSAGTWTTIFCVKASFLIISKQLLKRLRWLNIYFWFVVGLTFISWVIAICGQFIACPYTGAAMGISFPI